MNRESKHLLNAIWQEKNLVHADDSTSEIIRKHRLFSAITEAISKDELQRGRDFGGGEEDSVYNDLTETEEMLYERALLRHDREAMAHISDNKVDGTFWMSQALNVVEAAYEALLAYKTFSDKEAELEKAIQLLLTIKPDAYPHAENELEEPTEDRSDE
jgi:hypothetical protein